MKTISMPALIMIIDNEWTKSFSVSEKKFNMVSNSFFKECF